MGKMKWRVLKPEEYRAKVEAIIITNEDNVPSVYLDEKGIPTAGPGKALVVNVNRKWVVSQGRPVEGVEILEATTGKKITPEQRQMLQTAADNLNRYGSGQRAYEANAPVYYEDASLKGSAAWKTEGNSKFGVYLDKDQKIDFKNRVVDASEKEFDDSTTKTGTVRLDEKIPPSEERAALVSIYHQKRSDINNDMREAINSGDRAGVIEAIEGSDAAKTYKTRRKLEADKFGRPDDPVIIRHENNPQADLDGRMKAPQQSFPTVGFPAGLPQQGLPPQQPTGPASDVNPTTVPQASILDYFGKAAGQIGAAVSTVGHVAFDTAMSLGKDTLNQTLRLALSQGAGGKALVKQAAQMAVGNMLAGMHAQVIEKIMRDPTIPVGIAGPLERPQAPVEDVMNNPRNQGVFDQTADAVMRLLGRHPDLDPGTVLVDQGLKHIRQGDLNIPHGILLPDIFAMDRKTGADGSDGQYVEVLGIKLPIRLPDVRVIDESGAVNDGRSPGMPGGMPKLAAFRGGDGVVEVRAYSRNDASVRSHTRSKPDGDVTNNLSYRKA